MRSPLHRASRIPIAVVCSWLLFVAVHVSGQNPATTPPGPPGLTLLSKDGRRALPIAIVNGQESVALDDLAAAFQLTVREEAGAITVSYKGRTIVLTADQALASVSGRLVSLPAPPSRAGGRWLVPVEFIGRALALIYDTRLDLRRPSRLVVVGDLRVPRVSIRHEPLANAARLTIDAAPRATSTVTQEAGRLLVKFDADAIDTVMPVLQSQGIVLAIRLVDAVTIGVDVGPRFGAFRSSTESIEDTTRLVIDLVGVESNTTLSPGSPAAPSPPVPSEIPRPGQAVAAIRTIAVDAGHGGEDVGVKGDGGTAEKDLTLAVARRLKSAVEARLGIRVLLTRDEDRNVPIDERAAIANNSKADLFISLHANAASRGTPSGASIYVAAFNTAQEKQAKLAPERLPTFGGGLRDIELVEWDLAQLRYLDQSTEMARIVREQFDGRVPLDEHQLFDAGPFRVLESANMPAVLIEMGYLSNADQETALGSAEFQNTFVQAILDAVVKFREHLERQRARRPPLRVDARASNARAARRWRSARALVIVRRCAAGIAWLLFVGLPRWYGGPAARSAAAAAPLPPGRKIKARLFYVAEDGTKLSAVERDVAYGEGTVEQAREIINAQIAPAVEPLVSAVPPGTRLHALVRHRAGRGLRRSVGRHLARASGRLAE